MRTISVLLIVILLVSLVPLEPAGAQENTLQLDQLHVGMTTRYETLALAVSQDGCVRVRFNMAGTTGGYLTLWNGDVSVTGGQIVSYDGYSSVIDIPGVWLSVSSAYSVQLDVEAGSNYTLLVSRDSCDAHSDPTVVDVELDVPYIGNPFTPRSHYFEATGGETVDIRLTAHGSAAAMYLSSFDSWQLLASWAADLSGRVPGETLIDFTYPFPVPATGGYILDVEIPGAYGEYTLTIGAGENDMAEANYVSAGEKVEGEFLPGGSVDEWIIGVNPNGHTFVLVKTDPRLYPVINLVTPEGIVEPVYGSSPEPGVFYAMIDPKHSGRRVTLQVFEAESWWGPYSLEISDWEIESADQLHDLPVLPLIYNKACSNDGIMYFTLHLDYNGLDRLVEDGVLGEVQIAALSDERLIIVPYSDIFGELDLGWMLIGLATESIPFAGTVLDVVEALGDYYERQERMFVSSYRIFSAQEESLNTLVQIELLNMVEISNLTGGVVITTTWEFYDPDNPEVLDKVIYRNQYVTCGEGG